MADPAPHSETPKIEMYVKWGCPYCMRAKSLFERKGVSVDEYDITGDSALREEMIARAPGARTVPQIFIGGEAIGGSDDLARLDREGRLDSLLKQ